VEDWGKIRFLQKPACGICFEPFLKNNSQNDSENNSQNDSENNSRNDLICGACIKSRPAYFKALAVVKYDEFSKSLITKFKYADKTYAAKYFAELMYKQAKEILPDIDFIAPVPLHKLRMISRKFNQSALLAAYISKLSGIETIPDLLFRIKNTGQQTRLNKKSRSQNIAQAFILNEKYRQKISAKNILLIDDVITSGATINACCRILNKSGADKIYVISLAKTINRP
jgi:ComF family protein